MARTTTRTMTASMWLVALFLTAPVNAYAQAQPAKDPAAAQSNPQKQDRTLGKVLADSWITMRVHSMFIPDEALENSNIDVDTKAGVVTLSGTVPTDAGRSRAIEIAKMTDGVKSVNAQALRVVPDTTGTARGAAGAGKRVGRTVNDGWIKSKVYAQFLTEDSLNDSDIDIDVSKGMVSLSGTVRTEAGRSRAETIAKATEGVKNVKNAIKVTSK